MGTMLQQCDLVEGDFGGYDGCNEMLNLTRPQIVAGVHRAYFEAGADMVTTNTFGANLTVLGEYGLGDRLEELARAGAAVARAVADELSVPERPRWVLGSVGPGTKLASLGQATYAEVRESTYRQVGAMIDGGIDAVQIETSQDLLVIRAQVAGARRAVRESGVDVPVFVSVTVETTGTLLVGSDLTAVVASLTPLGIDAIGLNCATGPDQMRPYLRELAGITGLPLTCAPNAGMPVLSGDKAYYPLGPDEFAAAVAGFAQSYGLSVAGGCCGTTPDHIAALAKALEGRDGSRTTRTDLHDAVASLYTATALSQDVSYLTIGERANTAGSKAFREAVLASDWEAGVEIARAQEADGAHVLDLCVDYVGRDTVADMAELMSRIARDVDAPIQIDSANPDVIRTGLELCPGRAIVNSVSAEYGTGPGSRFDTIMTLVREHGSAVVGLCIDESGQARTTAEKLGVARRLIEMMTSAYGLELCDIIIDPLTFPIATGQEDTRRDALNTIEAIRAIRAEFPGVHTLAGVSNVSFGLKPAARQVLNSVYLDQARQAGLDCAIVSPGKIMAWSAIPEEQAQAALDLVLDRPNPDRDNLEYFLSLFEGPAAKVSAGPESDLPVGERLRRHILSGTVGGLADDLVEARAAKPALAIINEDLLDAMREVGERFGSGKMQLPFVLKSAEVMKQAVKLLEPYLDRDEGSGKGTLVLATVRGDVHDIGKNLVDIILTNNGYKVVNLGIKVPIGDIIAAAEDSGADAIGLSGLLVKSTQVMKENLEELNAAGLADKYPVLLGGAALTRAFVETDLAATYQGDVRYARDAFEGLSLMDAVVARRNGEGELPATRVRTPRAATVASAAGQRANLVRPVPGGVDVPEPPFTGVRYATANLDHVVPHLDKRALFAQQWGLKAGREGPGYDELVASDGEPRLAYWLDYLAREDLVGFRIAWGFWPCWSEGDDLVVQDGGTVRRFSFPRQVGGQQLCLADYFRDDREKYAYGPDVVAFQLVTLGGAVSERTAELFASDAYRDYFELHGLSVQLAEACAQLWHGSVRAELGLGEAAGERYSFGYPACPDLEQRRTVMDLLNPGVIGVELSDECQLSPEQSTEAMIVHHPEAHYFSAR